MSFILQRFNQNVDPLNSYLLIAQDFCTRYYAAYDVNLLNLADCYYINSQFTVQDKETVGFQNWYNLIRSYGYTKFSHTNMTITTQPIHNLYILISVAGTVYLNDWGFSNSFVETILLQRDEYNNFRVFSTILKIF